jgi:hypothetical protein
MPPLNQVGLGWLLLTVINIVGTYLWFWSDFSGRSLPKSPNIKG